MVHATNVEARRRGLAVSARVMDAERLEFAEGAFSRVLCGFGLMFFPHLDQALHEFRRLLELGGRVGVSIWQISQADDVRAALDELGLGVPGLDHGATCTGGPDEAPGFWMSRCTSSRMPFATLISMNICAPRAGKASGVDSTC